MHGMISRPSFLAFSLIALAVGLIPSMASASSHSSRPAESPPSRRTARITDSDPSREDHEGAESQACRHAKAPIEIVSGSASETLSLEKCDGATIPGSVDKLSIMARPTNTPKPKEPLAASKGHSFEVGPGIRRLDPRLAERLQLVTDHFRKDGETPRVVLVTGSKSRSAGSYHASGRAIDFRIDGQETEAEAAFCKTIQDTGCGFYPNSGFVHMDVRDPGTGHVAWIDVSKAGESPKYVTSWPLPEETPKAAPPRAEAAKEADNTEAAKLPSLPAAMQVAPLESPKRTEPPAETPAKKTRRHHRRLHRADHTI